MADLLGFKFLKLERRVALVLLYLIDVQYDCILVLKRIIICCANMEKLVSILEFFSEIIYTPAKGFESSFNNQVII